MGCMPEVTTLTAKEVDRRAARPRPAGKEGTRVVHVGALNRMTCRRKRLDHCPEFATTRTDPAAGAARRPLPTGVEASPQPSEGEWGATPVASRRQIVEKSGARPIPRGMKQRSSREALWGTLSSHAWT